MNKKWIIVAVVAVGAILLYNLSIGRYNALVQMEEGVSGAWANVEAQYQRRYDLIPNLVSTVKGFAEQEKEVLLGVTEARAKASSIQVDPSKLDEASIAQFSQAQGALNSALSRLLVTVEKYPDLKSNQNFLELQAQLEGTENRIAVARQRYNGEAQTYNTKIRQFPNNLVAGMFGFERKALFQADEAASSAPKVEF